MFWFSSLYQRTAKIAPKNIFSRMHLPSDSTTAVYTGTTAPSTDWTNSNHHQHTASVNTLSISSTYTKGGMLSEPPRHSHNSDNNGNSTNSSNNNNNANTTNNNITSNSNNSGSATSVGSASPSSNNVNNELWWTSRLVLEAQQEFPGELG